jgi:Iron/zinc purple acid phosphatase-like protein C
MALFRLALCGSHRGALDAWYLVAHSFVHPPLLCRSHRSPALVCGHVHAYERLYPVYRRQTTQKNYDNPRALPQIIVGNAGNLEGFPKLWDKESPEYLAKAISEYGYARLTVHNATTLSWVLYNATNNGVLDEMVLTKAYPRSSTTTTEA